MKNPMRPRLLVSLLCLFALPALAQQRVYIRYQSGTGFFISYQGHLVTNAHVVAGCPKQIQFRIGANRYDVDLIASDPKLDLAVLQARQGLGIQPLPIRSNDYVPPGGLEAAVVGFPGAQPNEALDLPKVVATRVFQPDEKFQDAEKYLLFENAAEHGNSGGPLVDRTGQVLGVVSAKGRFIRTRGGSVMDSREADISIRPKVLREFLDHLGVNTIARDLEGRYPLDLLRVNLAGSVGNVVCEVGREVQ